MGKKGLSLEEKRQKILEIFHKKKEVFNIKEIENLGSKAGLNPNIIKDVVQSLLDDNLVETDKIGIGNFLWALPSKSRQNRISRLESLKSSLMDLKSQKKHLSQFIENELSTKSDSADRLSKLDQLKTLTETLSTQGKLRDSLRSCTKQYYDECYQKMKTSLELANKHTDNVFSAKKFLQNRLPSLSTSDFNSHFNIPEDFDNID